MNPFYYWIERRRAKAEQKQRKAEAEVAALREVLRKNLHAVRQSLEPLGFKFCSHMFHGTQKSYATTLVVGPDGRHFTMTIFSKGVYSTAPIEDGFSPIP